MIPDRPRSHLGIALVAVVAGGAAMLLLLALSATIAFVLLLPWILGAMGLYNAVRAQSLPSTQTDEIADRGKRALHFSIFSLSISAIFVVIGLMALWFMSSGA